MWVATQPGHVVQHVHAALRDVHFAGERGRSGSVGDVEPYASDAAADAGLQLARRPLSSWEVAGAEQDGVATGCALPGDLTSDPAVRAGHHDDARLSDHVHRLPPLALRRPSRSRRLGSSQPWA